MNIDHPHAQIAGTSANRPGDRMRIALVVPGFPTPENPRRGIFNLRAQQALSSFADVTVLFLRAWAPGRPRRRVDESAGTRTITITAPQLPVLRMLGSRFSVAANILLYRIFGWAEVRETLANADIVHSVDGTVGMVVSDWASRVRKRHVTQLIGSDINIVMPRLPAFAARGWEKWLHAVICNSKALALRFSALYPDVPNVQTIPRGVDPDTFTPTGPMRGPQAHERPVRFAFFGGFQRRPLSPRYVKGGPILLAAWKDAEDELLKTGASLLLAGPDCRSDLVARWHRGLRYPRRVHVVGEVPPTEMPEHLRAVDAVLVPSFAEGLPNVCMEASASGRGVLASDVGGIPDVIVDRETGLILPPGDVKAWASALVAYSAQADALREMGRCGRMRVRRFFDSRDYGTRVLALYQDALSLSVSRGR